MINSRPHPTTIHIINTVGRKRTGTQFGKRRGCLTRPTLCKTNSLVGFVAIIFIIFSVLLLYGSFLDSSKNVS